MWAASARFVQPVAPWAQELSGRLRVLSRAVRVALPGLWQPRRVLRLVSEGLIASYLPAHRAVRLDPTLYLGQGEADEQRKVQVLVVRVRLMLTEPTGLTPQQRDRLVEVVAEEVVASGAAPEEGSRNAAIDRLYAELRQLMSRSESSADSETEQKLALLRTLQREEAAAMRERYIARSPLKPGAGWQALDEARRLLSENENPPSQNPTLPR